MKEKITSSQFLAIMFLAPYGTASLFFTTPETKNDVWIALLFYSFTSIIIQMIYINLFNKYPKDSIVTYLPKIYGKYIGFILSIIYIYFFAYDAARGLRDFTELTTSFALIRMPVYIIAATSMIIITYSVYKGIENIGSMSQIGFLILLASTIIIYILLFMTKNILHFNNILPILHNGFIFVALKGWKLSIFPYGEFVVMTMLYSFLLQRNRLKKTIILTSILEGISLTLNNILFITALGYEFAVLNQYPLLETLRLVRIGDFLNRLDIIFLVVLMLGGFFKISILMYASALGISQLFRIKNWGLLCSVLGIIISITSFIIAENNPEHINIGWNYVMVYFFPFIVIIIPLLSLIVYHIKKFVLKIYAPTK
ncbi:spore germination protein KB [Clostridium pasteurianum DSM 525 = ATCC 6013]|uniref:Spore germination protein n=1 Tax=Clostridium pasteurianum DSM 525 = ATCC 6013 TaxID=1262449 RepID=A0A0H3JA60_CLOPA|nr:GerAB/ArcD/ProY family transporter [Clostridium pasteurianum]AJA49268.1 spore germination protein KB [Clostridium pasteurianum DSM 525 = ATCC 6013]AJA53256.1 spore germination protein KB [Clostridium pasteurianum DSM 525 = ATCC 6013]AOZ76446.1 spore gernimation protein [Clostridium pasteurianum DSM 525 = ATCC 6013]AOZ80243.1 spore gernimation protein [Clostridium pasteurianum]ELP58288.1 spore germination protein KB [Clostridium pasteurianum DSM 525 = ATCC 6013]